MPVSGGPIAASELWHLRCDRSAEQNGDAGILRVVSSIRQMVLQFARVTVNAQNNGIGICHPSRWFRLGYGRRRGTGSQG